MSAEIDLLLANLTAEEQKAENALSQWQHKLDEIRGKRQAVETTATLLKNGSPALPLGTGRYAKMETSEALLDCVNSFGGALGLTRSEAAKMIKEHGFKYGGNPKNFYAAVSIALTRLAIRGKIQIIDGDGATRFRPLAAANTA